MLRWLIILLAVPSVAVGQSWCPPGATWTYTYAYEEMFDAVAVFNYVGDVPFKGTTVQQINWQIDGFSYGQPYQESGPPLLTQTIGDVVYMMGNIQFDTLYHFGAIPGDSWPAAWGSGNSPRVLVLDTGSVTIDDMPLRFLVVDNSWAIDTIVERLGSLHGFMAPWSGVMNDEPGGPLRCYSDMQIEYVAPWWDHDCNAIVNVGEQTAKDLSIFPNPGGDQFNLSLSPGTYNVALFDATGRTVLQEQVLGSSVVIGTAKLPSGVYVVRVDDEVQPMRWVKE